MQPSRPESPARHLQAAQALLWSCPRCRCRVVGLGWLCDLPAAPWGLACCAAISRQAVRALQACATPAAAAASVGGAARRQRQRRQRRGPRPCTASLQPRPPADGGEQQHEHAGPAVSLLQRAAGAGAALAATALLLSPGGAAQAADAAKVGACLLQNCQSALTNCLADGPCVQNLVCLQLCNDSPDETACQVGGCSGVRDGRGKGHRLTSVQTPSTPLLPHPPSLPAAAVQIKCGDRYTSGAIEAFNTCVVSEKKCVPQRVDKGALSGLGVSMLGGAGRDHAPCRGRGDCMHARWHERAKACRSEWTRVHPVA